MDDSPVDDERCSFLGTPDPTVIERRPLGPPEPARGDPLPEPSVDHDLGKRGWLPGCLPLPMLLSVAALLLALFLSGCGECQPSAAYTVPAHWDRAYSSSESYVAYYYTRYSCYYYTNSYGERRRSCTSYQQPHYRYYTVDHPAQYHPAQYVPAVVCPTKSS